MPVNNLSEDNILVSFSPECLEEKRYIAEVLLGEYLGWDITFDERSDIKGIELKLHGHRGRLMVNDDFFRTASEKWLDESTLPNSNPRWCVDEVLTSIIGEQKIPVFYGDINKGGSWWKLEEGVGELALDVFGTCFYFLSRYEEAVIEEADCHGRFPSSASTLGKWGLLDRPIVNEYLEILWACAKQIWPNIIRKPRQFRCLPSHDIDWPFQFLDISWKIAALNSLRAIKHGKAGSAVNWSWRYLCYRLGSLESDPYNMIRWIMEQSDERGLKSAFYYIPQQTHPELDPEDYLDHPNVMAQWKMIIERGHEIGVHPGYETYKSSEAIKEAAESIRNCLVDIGHSNENLGGRQHFLRWTTPDTGRHWEQAGLAYDSTLGFADAAGFRCGTCYEYPLYDVIERKSLNLREKPLLVMDCTVVDDQYMGLGLGQEAYDTIVSLKETCRKYCGDFTLLWHNQRFARSEEREFYTSILDA